MNNEDFKQTVLDYFEIEQRRYQSIMALITDVQANNKAILAAVTEHVANVKTMLAELAATGAVGHAAVLDGVVADQVEILAAVKAADEEIVAAGKAVQLPAPPVA
jgi:hypothetical protein